jgi:Ni,Fe-hydrogenase III large subunit
MLAVNVQLASCCSARTLQSAQLEGVSVFFSVRMIKGFRCSMKGMRGHQLRFLKFIIAIHTVVYNILEFASSLCAMRKRHRSNGKFNDMRVPLS